jgi:hypothetical protein
MVQQSSENCSVTGVHTPCVRLVLSAEVGQADPPTDEPQLAFDRLVGFFKQHLA